MSKNKWQELAEHLQELSKFRICKENGCTEENHNCESYAYITRDGELLDICAPDYFQGSDKPHVGVMLPFVGDGEALKEAVTTEEGTSI